MNIQTPSTGELKLFMILLGSKAPGRNVEQHDFFFGIATTLTELVPGIKAFWPEAREKIHIDAWREVTTVENYQVNVVPRSVKSSSDTPTKRLFFINLGGYQENKFEEQHYVLLTVKDDRASAFKEAKGTSFFKHNHAEGATSHIDDKYGNDVDDLYEIEDILSPLQKERYRLDLIPVTNLQQDRIHLGYLKLKSL